MVESWKGTIIMESYPEKVKSNLLETYIDWPSQHLKRVVFAFMSLFILIFAIYGNTFSVPFQFDDFENISNNKRLHLTEVTVESIKKTFHASPNNSNRIYRPVACFSFALNYYFGRDNVFGYHLVNVFIHFITSAFLFLFIYHTLNLASVKEKYSHNAYFISFLATILWASNPVQTQAITYIVQRMASMAAMFYMMAMYFYLKGRTADQVFAKISFFFFFFISAILALGSNVNSVMLPFSLMIYDLMLIQGISKENIKKTMKPLLLIGLIVLGFGIIYTHGNPFSLLEGYKGRPFTLSERLLTESRIIVFYISVLLYPVPTRLNIAHDIVLSHSFFGPFSTILSILLIGSIIVVALFLSKKESLLCFCIIFFFLNHIVESSILPLELIFEHRNYLPSMFFFVPIGILVMKILNYFSYKKSMQTIIAIFTIFIIVGQGHATYMRNYVWKTEESLWKDAVAKAPNLSRTHMNLGKSYSDQGFVGKAIRQFELAIQINRYAHISHRVQPHLNLAVCYRKAGQFDKVIAQYCKVNEINPDIALSYDNMAMAFLAKGDIDAAYDNFIKSLTLDRNNAHAHNNLGRIVLEQGNPQLAIIEFKKALKLDSDLTEALINMAMAYKQREDYDKSIRYFKKALLENANPGSRGNINARLGLIELYSLTGDDNALEKALAGLIRSVNKITLYEIVHRLERSKRMYHPLIDAGIILSEMGKAFLREAKEYREKGEYCLRKNEEIDKNEAAPLK